MSTVNNEEITTQKNNGKKKKSSEFKSKLKTQKIMKTKKI